MIIVALCVRPSGPIPDEVCRVRLGIAEGNCMTAIVVHDAIKALVFESIFEWWDPQLLRVGRLPH